MKQIILAAAVAMLAISAAQAETTSGSVCLKSYQIKDTKTPDDQTIIFHMDNGDVWKNTLRNSCPELKFNGFEYTATPPDEICGNLQAIRVIRAHTVCLLGPFTKVSP
jgi:hypothetical protein